MKATNKFKAHYSDACGCFEEIDYRDSGVQSGQQEIFKQNLNVVTMWGIDGSNQHAWKSIFRFFCRSENGTSYMLEENEPSADQLNNEVMYYTLVYSNPIQDELIDKLVCLSFTCDTKLLYDKCHKGSCQIQDIEINSCILGNISQSCPLKGYFIFGTDYQATTFFAHESF